MEGGKTYLSPSSPYDILSPLNLDATEERKEEKKSSTDSNREGTRKERKRRMEKIAIAFVRKEVPVFLKKAYDVCTQIDSLVSSELVFHPYVVDEDCDGCDDNNNSVKGTSNNITRPERMNLKIICRNCEIVTITNERGGIIISTSSSSYSYSYPVLQLAQIKSFVYSLIETLRAMRSAILAGEMKLIDVRESLRAILSDVNECLFSLKDETLPEMKITPKGGNGMKSGEIISLRLVEDKFFIGDGGNDISVCERLGGLRGMMSRLNDVLQRLYDKASVLTECMEDVGMSGSE